MTQFTRRVAAAGAAALALTISMGASTATAGPATAGSAPSYAPSWLAVDTKNSQVRFADSTGLLAPTQSLATDKACALVTDGSLVDFTGAPVLRRVVPTVGYQTGGFGVRESATASGTSCSAVDAVNTESLTLKLGTVNGLVASSASLDINLKQNARILATATRTKDGTTTASYYELQSGTNIGEESSKEGATVFQCNNPSDSGPDSGTSNNCRWEISGPSWTKKRLPDGTPVLVDGKPVSAEDGKVFDTLTLEAVTGSFSLMGGADGYVDNPNDPLPGYFGASGPSVFELVEGLAGCGDTVTLDPTELHSTWFRLPNFAPAPAAATASTQATESCTPFPYSSRTGQDSKGFYAEFTKPLDFETNAQALWTTIFFVGGKPTDPLPPITVTLDYLDAQGNKAQLELPNLGKCASSYGTRDNWVGPESEPNGPTACLVEAVRLSGKLKGYATYTAYIYGDAGMRN